MEYKPTFVCIWLYFLKHVLILCSGEHNEYFAGDLVC